MEKSEKLWSRNFVLIIVINFLVFMNHIMLLSTFPFYIESLGGSEALAGLAATLFSFVAVLCRQFVGWMLDNGKRRAILAGYGFGGLEPALQSMVVHSSSPAERGSANSTFLCAYDIGIGLGGGFAGWLITAAGYENMSLVLSAARRFRSYRQYGSEQC